jgi:TM2 domain-containing membrane protein YozV
MFSSTTQIQPHDPPKKPIVVAIVSLLLFGGVGQIHLGQTKKGIFFILATIALIPIGIGFIVWIAGIIDAYVMAEKLQKGQAIGDMQWFWEN